MKFIKTLATAGALSLALGACSSNSNGVHLTPQPSGNNVQPAGPFTQIERLSRPAVKEVFETFVQHQQSNAVEPYADATIQGAIKSTEDALRPPTANTDYGTALQGVLYPDEYTVDLTQTKGGFLGAETKGAVPGSGPFGGRNINDDVIGVELFALFGKGLSVLGLQQDDGQANTCISSQGGTAPPGKPALNIDPSQASTTTFPYLHTPH